MMDRTTRPSQGFTLIELLIVVAIIGILAAIAIPQYNQYRKQAQNSAAQSDLRNLQTALEATYAQNGTYPSQSNADGSVPSSVEAFSASEDVTVQYYSNSDDAYEACSSHDLSDKVYYVTASMSSLNSTESSSDLSKVSCGL